MSEWLALGAALLAGSSGLPGLFLSSRSNAGQYMATVMNGAGSLLGISAALRVLLLGPDQGLSFPLWLRGAEFSVEIDALSAAFLLPIFLISGLGDVYGLGYWKQEEHQRNGRWLRVFYGLLTAGLVLVVVARNGVVFLVGWEVMALSCFFAMTSEDHDPQVRQAGWIYFASTHLSTLALFAFFALLWLARGSLDLAPFPPEGLSPRMADALFLLALVAFGLKAGLFPLHFWLPPAHASAPSHVSAFMSGVLIKMGVYGILRFLWMMPADAPWWGETLLCLGALSGVLGVAFAIGQHDLKRLLAYHSIENIGIIFMGIGLAVMGKSQGRPDWVALGLAGAVLHTWNHGLFKALLFLSAGSVIHATHTREIDHLGGLAKALPFTAFSFLLGAAAICGLPPLNGFVSELLIYLGLFKASVTSGPAAWGLAAFAIPVLALIGGLALACFVKVYGGVFLGTPRSGCGEHARESGAAMMAPMGILAGLCAFIGLLPAAPARLLDAVTAGWSPAAGEPAMTLSASAPLQALSWIGAATLALVVIGMAALFRGGTLRASNACTWDCGYSRPTAAMQYTSSSFAQMIVGMFRWALFPSASDARVRGLFPAAVRFQSSVPDTVLDRLILPAFTAAAWACSWFRLLQRGKVHAYLFYIFITLLILLLWK